MSLVSVVLHLSLPEESEVSMPGIEIKKLMETEIIDPEVRRDLFSVLEASGGDVSKYAVVRLFVMKLLVVGEDGRSIIRPGLFSKLLKHQVESIGKVVKPSTAGMVEGGSPAESISEMAPVGAGEACYEDGQDEGAEDSGAVHTDLFAAV